MFILTIYHLTSLIISWPVLQGYILGNGIQVCSISIILRVFWFKISLRTCHGSTGVGFVYNFWVIQLRFYELVFGIEIKHFSSPDTLTGTRGDTNAMANIHFRDTQLNAPYFIMNIHNMFFSIIITSKSELISFCFEFCFWIFGKSLAMSVD